VDDKAWENECKEREKRRLRLEVFVRKAIREVETWIMPELGPRYHFSLFFGAIGADPKYLVIWYFMESDADLKQVKQNGLAKRVDARTRKVLAKHSYPKDVLDKIHVAFGSHEDVVRWNDGNYYQYLK